jgi:1-acyl-sn-glycerol-3-phosphate acyltransferase
MTKVKDLLWLPINVVQVILFAISTSLLILYSVSTAIVTKNPGFALRMAHTTFGPLMLWLARARLEIEGLDRIDLKTPKVFVSNHQSMLDIVVMQKTIPANIRFIYKEEINKIPFVGWCCRSLGMISVDRTSARAISKVADAAQTKFADFNHIVAFPEGTRTVDGQVSSFKKGAFLFALKAQMDIVPVCIDGAFKVLPTNSLKTRPGKIRVRFGTPISVAGLSTGDDREHLRAEAQRAVETLLDEKHGERAVAQQAA